MKMKDCYEFSWGYFAPRAGFDLIVNRGGYFDQRYSVNICLGWGYFSVNLPFKTKIPESCDTPKYGMQIHSRTFWLHLGGKMNQHEQCNSKWITWDLPFVSWIHEWHRVVNDEMEWEPYSYDRRDQRYYETHPYAYTLKSGEVQNIEAKCSIGERHWHRKWWPISKNRRRSINIEFSDEVGEKSGSWKGGCVGCGYEMLEGESIKDCLSRMEVEREFR